MAAAKKGSTGAKTKRGKGSGGSKTARKGRGATAKKRSKRKPSSSSLPRNEVIGIVLLTLAVMLAVAVLSFHPDDPPNGSSLRPHNLLGIAGAYLADAIVHYSFGRLLSLVLPLLLGFAGFDILRGRTKMPLLRRSILPLLSGVTLAAAIWGLVRAFTGQGEAMVINGLIGWSIDRILLAYLGRYGAAILLGMAVVVYITVVLRIHWREVFGWIATAFNAAAAWLRRLMPSLPKVEIEPPAPRDEPRERKVITLKRPRFGRGKEGEDEAAEAPAAKTPPVVKPKPEAKAEPAPEPAAARKPRLATAGQPADEEEPSAPEAATPEPAARPKPRINRPEPAQPRPEADEAMRDEPIDTSVPESSDGLPEPDPSKYKLPPVSLLKELEEAEQIEELSEEELAERAELLEETLSEFGVEASVVAIHPGPVITRYDLKPAAGVKVSKITNLAEDLALAMATTSVRMVPLPGAVGIEVPNPDQAPVSLSEVVRSKSFDEASSPLAIALGKTAQGEHMIVDLAKMPHLLIAGTTGSGKSVCINTIITSLLMRNQPHEVMIAMIDPKKIELSAYAELRRHHLLFIEDGEEVISTDAKNSVSLLKSMVREMEARYDRLAESGARSIGEYNRFVERGKVQDDDDGSPARKLPYIVMIVDEFADLMLTARGEIEEPIARLAQMARAVGIHLVVATQRPSVNVLTGVIKANFPARIAFNVATKIDSRTILDRPGAEALLGRGDGLYLAGTSPQAVRFHGAFISTEEVQEVIAHVHNQPMFLKQARLTAPDGGGGSGGEVDDDDDRDELFEDGVRTVVRHQQGSVSLLQRRLKIGYSRAGRLLDQLEQAGIVGPFEGSKARDVLLSEDDMDEWLADRGY